MALSEVSIANSALSRIGAGSLIALTDDTAQGRAMLARFAGVRDAELTRHVWNFSVRRLNLAALATAPTFGYAYQFQLPSDCLRVLAVGDTMPGVDLSWPRSLTDSREYTVEGNLILHQDAGPLPVRYVSRIEDVTQFDAAFAEALAARLAYELCTQLSGSNSLKQLAWADYQSALADALRSNALQLPPQPIPDDSWMLARQ